MTLLIGVAAVVVGLSLPPAPAPTRGMPVPVESVCPVDDQKFTWTTTTSYTIFDTALDGQPIGSWHFPLDIGQCPDSKFPVYKEEFTEEEKQAIRELVARPEYKAIQDEASYYVLSFVLSRLEEPEPLDTAWYLVQATWQVRDDAPRYRRYALETLAALDAGLEGMRESEPENWWYLQIVASNIERQSGDFEAATRRLDALPAEVPAEGSLAKRIALTRQLVAEHNQELAVLPDPRFSGDA